MKEEFKNILIIKNPFESQGFSGGEVHTMQVASYLRSKGHNIFFAGTCPDLLEAAKKENFPVEYINIGGKEAVGKIAVLKFIFTWPMIYFKYKKYLNKVKKENNINILYLLSWNEKFLLAPMATKLGMRTFFVEHRLLGRYIYWNPFRLFYKYGTKFAKVIAVSLAVKKELLKLGVKSEKIEVIYNGIDEKKFTNVNDGKFTKKQDEIVIGTISRLYPDKGLEYLLEGFKKASEKMYNLSLKIVGSGPSEKELKSLARELKIENADFLGRIAHSDIPKFLKSIDIFTLTSVWGESFGIVLGEAGLMGKPCIATNIGGMPEVIKDGETGIIIEPKSSQAVADAIIKLAGGRQLAKVMGENAKKRIEKYFLLGTMLNKIEKLVCG